MKFPFVEINAQKLTTLLIKLKGRYFAFFVKSFIEDLTCYIGCDIGFYLKKGQLDGKCPS